MLHEGRNAEGADEDAQDEEHEITLLPETLHPDDKENHSPGQAHPGVPAAHTSPSRFVSHHDADHAFPRADLYRFLPGLAKKKASDGVWFATLRACWGPRKAIDTARGFRKVKRTPGSGGGTTFHAGIVERL